MVRGALTGLLLMVCGPAGAGEAVRVVIDKYRFDPPVVTVAAGTEIEWVNAEKRTSHSIQIDGMAESERLFPGESHRHVFHHPGRFGYRCGPHPEMVGTVEVR